jgi:hypothetical protein
MKDPLTVLLGFSLAIVLFSLRVKHSGGWNLLPKSKFQSLFELFGRRED